jgi:hypothetical protein
LPRRELKMQAARYAAYVNWPAGVQVQVL